MNQFGICGRLVNDFVLEEKNGIKMTRNSIARDRTYKNKDGVIEADYFNFTLFNDDAERACRFLKKGDLVGLTGSLKTFKNEIVLNVDYVDFLATYKPKEIKKDEIEMKI